MDAMLSFPIQHLCLWQFGLKEQPAAPPAVVAQSSSNGCSANASAVALSNQLPASSLG